MGKKSDSFVILMFNGFSTLSSQCLSYKLSCGAFIAKRLFQISSNLLPVCLPSSKRLKYSNKKAVVTGWGRLSSGGASPSNLQEVSVPVRSSYAHYDPGVLEPYLHTNPIRGLHEPPVDIRSLREAPVDVRSLHEPPVDIRGLHEPPVDIRGLHEPPVDVRSLREAPVDIRSLHEHPVDVRSLHEAPVDIRSFHEPLTECTLMVIVVVHGLG
ncbi:Serine proteases trypsin domain [Trinorchestia longiramus]|nr:Serine proteases trypsin domain [Trinorchestia longiramus]